MDKLFKCQLDGLVMYGGSEDDLVAQIQHHLAEDHPDLVGTYSRDEILALIREQAATA